MITCMLIHVHVCSFKHETFFYGGDRGGGGGGGKLIRGTLWYT